MIASPLPDRSSLSVSGGSRHADPPRRLKYGTGLVVAGAAVPAIDALNPIQLAAGNVGAGAGRLITERIVSEVLSCPAGLNGPGGHAA